MTPLHLGPAHEVEQWLTLVLAVGPFLVLAVVVVLRRRQDAEDDVEDDVEPADAAQDR